ncbi:MAG: peptidase T [Blautia sp.]|nr:peptidase T [Blautia sp.]
MRAYERMLKYVKIWTTSDPESDTVPSALRELDLAYLLADEMKTMGIQDAHVDAHGYVYGFIPAAKGYEQYPAVGLIAHMDTVADCCGEHVDPQIIYDYNGEDVPLGESGKVLRCKEFPHLRNLKGRTLITTDGTTLLGADDKAGIAEILTVAEEIMNAEKPHCRICICFTPDEEIGRGADHFDLEKFDARYAYTLDGGPEGEIQYENFNAASAIFTITGKNIHPGSAKDIMLNSQSVAMEVHAMLPKEETPECTGGYEGFYHLHDMKGNTECTVLKYLIRDFDSENFKRRKEFLYQVQNKVNEKYTSCPVALEIQDTYFNMREMLEPCMHLIDYAKMACEKEGLKPDLSPVRGGTDGARLSYKGLPCPNLGTGGYGYHGEYEHITAEGMDKAVAITKRILYMFVN